MAQGERAYTDWREWPHAFAPYGPLAYYGAGWMTRLLAPHDRAAGPTRDIVIDDPREGETPFRIVANASPTYRDVYSVGRVISEVSIAGIFALMIAFGRLAGLSWRWCVLAVALFTSWLGLLEYTSSFRPDAPQAFFSLFALWIGVKFPPKPATVVLAFALLGVAMFFKPTSWTVGLVLGYWVFRGHGFGRAVLALAAFGAAGLSLVVALDFRWEGALFANMIGSLDNGWEPRNWSALVRHLPLLPAFVLALGWGASIAMVKISRGSSESVSLLWVAAALSPAVALAQYLKVGADINYMLEPYALASVAAAYTARKITVGEMGNSISGGLRTLLMVLGLGLLLFDSAREIWTAPGDLKIERSAWNDLPPLPDLKPYSGPILSSSPYLTLAASAEQTPLDHIQYMVLFRRGLIADRSLVTRVEDRYFSLIVLPWDVDDAGPEVVPIQSPWYSPGFMEALRANYRPLKRVGVYVLLEPRT